MRILSVKGVAAAALLARPPGPPTSRGGPSGWTIRREYRSTYRDTATASEKVVAGAIHASAAGLLALPLMIVLMHQVTGVDVQPRWALLLPLVGVSGVLSASFGLNLGTRIEVRYAGLLFSVLLGPMMLFGCAYYPWASLTAIGAFQYLFLVNPLVFISEAMRLAVTPEIPHMPVWMILTGLFGYAAAVIAGLVERGAEVRFHDPHVDTFTDADGTEHMGVDLADLLASSDAVVVVTPHRAIDWDRVYEQADLVVDTVDSSRDREVRPRQVLRLGAGWSTRTSR